MKMLTPKGVFFKTCIISFCSFCLVFLTCPKIFAQKPKPQNLGWNYFALFDKKTNDSIRFLVSQTIDKQTKGIFLFCQGSTPQPLILQENGKFVFAGLPFDHMPFRNQYRFVVVSKPGIPVVADSTELAAEYYYIDKNTGALPNNYLNFNNLQYYTYAHQKVLDFLCKQNWVNKNKIVVAGHSQGYRVAANLAAQPNTPISHLICASSNPYSRFHNTINIRQQEYAGEISPQVAQKKIDTLYAQFKELLKFKNDKLRFWDWDSYYNWASFTDPPAVDMLLSTQIPILVCYGTADTNALLNDMLPFEFIRRNKNNLTLKPFPNYDHNFFEPIYKNSKFVSFEFHWDEVAKWWFKWINRNSNPVNN